MVSMHLPHVPRSDAWPGKPHPLQVELAEQGIEAPVFEWQERLHLRVSCHLYNAPEDIDRLPGVSVEEQARSDLGLRHESETLVASSLGQ